MGRKDRIDKKSGSVSSNTRGKKAADEDDAPSSGGKAIIAKAHISAKQRRRGQQDNYKKSWVAFNEQLRGIGLTLRTIGSDGNCLFRSISDQLLGDQEQHGKIREAIVDYIEAHPLDFSPFIWDQTFESYCKQMRAKSEWGGAMELSAATRKWGMHICVHQFGAPRLEHLYDPLAIIPDPNSEDTPVPLTKDTKTIHIAYHGADGEHYSSVRNISDAHSFEPATPIVIPSAPLSTSSSSSSSSSSSQQLSHQETIVTQSIPITNIDKIRKMLKESWNDPNVVIEMLYAEQALGLDINIDHDELAAKQEEEIAQQKKALEEKALRDRALAVENQRKKEREEKEAAEKRAAARLEEEKRKQSDEHDGDVAMEEESCENETKEEASTALEQEDAGDVESLSDDERDAIAAVEAYESFGSSSSVPASSSVAASSSSSSSSSSKVPPKKKLVGREKRLAQKSAKLLAEREKRLKKGLIKKERAVDDHVQAIANDVGSLRI